MAVDEAILQAHVRGEMPPTLRLYFFDPPCMTIGRNQQMLPDAVAEIERQGVQVVRRPTGGRAVLHVDDLTYSFTGSDTTVAGGFLSTSVTVSYKQICQGLLEAFRQLGVDCELGQAGTAYRHLQDCFLATTGCDLHFRGTKLIGSAQVRRNGGVLQHGSVPLRQDPLLMPKLLGSSFAADGAGPRHCNLFEAAGRGISDDELAAAFKRGFERAFSVQFEPARLEDYISVDQSSRKCFQPLS